MQTAMQYSRHCSNLNSFKLSCLQSVVSICIHSVWSFCFQCKISGCLALGLNIAPECIHFVDSGSIPNISNIGNYQYWAFCSGCCVMFRARPLLFLIFRKSGNTATFLLQQEWVNLKKVESFKKLHDWHEVGGVSL